MQLKDVALKNLQRRKSKMLFMVFGMVFGIATIVALFTLTTSMENSVTKKIQEAGLKLAVVPRTDTVSFSVGGIPVVSGMSYDAKDLPADVIRKIRSAQDSPKIKVIAPKIMGTTTIDGKKMLLVGVDFPGELAIKSWWEISGARPERDNQVLIGAKAAEKLNLVPGSTFTAGKRSLKVTGVLHETGEDEDGIAFTTIRTAREVLGKSENYSFIELNIPKDEKLAADLSADIVAAVPGARVKVVKAAAEARQELVERFSKFSLVVSFVMIIIAALIITTTMIASVNERTREIGILRAIGFRKAHITKVILMEAGIVSGVSGIAGYVAGMAAAYLIAPLFSGFSLAVVWDPLLGIGVLAGAVILGMLSGIYPSSKAAKLDPAEALRFI